MLTNSPRNQSKKYSVMRFNGSINVDFAKWGAVKMERENNQVHFKSWAEEMPKFGAGSEYGREQREEARRKKFGITSKKYRPEDQPWLLSQGDKTGKKYRGVSPTLFHNLTKICRVSRTQRASFHLEIVC